MKVCIASGKGGTGKTTLAVNLAWTLSQRQAIQLLDCDVEAPNGHLFLNLKERMIQTDVHVKKPVWNLDLCANCGECAQMCHFNAIAKIKNNILFFSELCHACGACAYICPNQAISEEDIAIGKVFQSGDPEFNFTYGELNIGEVMAPTVVAAVKNNCDPEIDSIWDAPPGTSCAVVETMRDSDLVALVTEPTPFGLHDLKLALRLALDLKIPTGVIVNRSESDNDLISDYLEKVGVPVIGRIPYDRRYAEAYSRGEILADKFPELADKMNLIWNDLKHLSFEEVPHPPKDEIVHVSNKTAKFATGTSTKHREIVVLSGKGGTGKTTVTAALTSLLDDFVVTDCDVDAADLHLLTGPENIQKHEFTSGLRMEIDSETCFGCGKCAEVCRFEAIALDGPPNDLIQATYKIDNIACEGCGLCVRVCPNKSIREFHADRGEWYFASFNDETPMIHARLDPGEENSGKLVALVRTEAKEWALKFKRSRILTDGPPGVGCPVIASLGGADLALMVSEATVSGLHDLERVLNLTSHFKIPARVIINKSDLNIEITEKIRELATTRNTEVIAELPFDMEVNKALMSGKNIIDHGKGQVFKKISDLGQKIVKILTQA